MGYRARQGVGMDLGLDGRVALIAGGSTGIGRAAAIRLAAEGAAVAVLARSAEKVEAVVAEIRASGGQAIGVPADVSDLTAVDAAVARVEETFGPPRIFVWSIATRFVHA